MAAYARYGQSRELRERVRLERRHRVIGALVAAVVLASSCSAAPDGGSDVSPAAPATTIGSAPDGDGAALRTSAPSDVPTTTFTTDRASTPTDPPTGREEHEPDATRGDDESGSNDSTAESGTVDGSSDQAADTDQTGDSGPSDQSADGEPSESGAGSTDGTGSKPQTDAGSGADEEPDESGDGDRTVEPNTVATYVSETQDSVLVTGHGAVETTLHLPSGRWTAHLTVTDNTGKFVVVLGPQNLQCHRGPDVIVLVDRETASLDLGFAVRPFVIGRTEAAWCHPGPFWLDVTATGSWSVQFAPASETAGGQGGFDDTGAISTITGRDLTRIPVSFAPGTWSLTFPATAASGSASLEYLGPYYSDSPECMEDADRRVSRLSGDFSPGGTATMTVHPPAHEWCVLVMFTLTVNVPGVWTLELREGNGEARRDAADTLKIAESDGEVAVSGSGPTGTVVSLGEGSWIAESAVTGNGHNPFTVELHGTQAACGLRHRPLILAGLAGDTTSADMSLPLLIDESSDAWCKPGEFVLFVRAIGEWTVTFTDVSSDLIGDGTVVGGIQLRPVRPNAKTGPEPRDPTFTQISVGDRYACGVTTDSEIECWGSDNTWGQASAPEGKYTQVAAGDNHTCALRADKTVHCWGDGYHGQTAVPSGEFIQVTTSCALRADGSFTCWGSRVGNVESPPDLLLGALGERSSCGLRDNSTLACWYFREADDYGDPAELVLIEAPEGRFAHVGSKCGVRSDGSVACWYASPPDPSSPPGGGSFTQTSDLCGITTAGTVECWGTGQYGYANRPSEAPPGKYTQISSSGAHACALRTDGKVRCWGSNYGSGPEPPSTRFSEVSVGSAHPCGITVGGSIECWDREYRGIVLTVDDWEDPAPGELPTGSFEAISVGGFREAGSVACAVGTSGALACWDYFGDMTVPGGEFADVSVGRGQTCALRTNGKVECWAWSTDNTVPQPNPDHRFDSVSASTGYACGVRTDGTLACWGASSDAWPDAPPTGTFSEVAVGWYRACAVTTTGQLTCWSWTQDALDKSKLRTPADPPGGEFTSVSVSTRFACGLRTNGTVACWGAGTIGRSRPPSVTFTQISVGPSYACGVTSNGSVRCWG